MTEAAAAPQLGEMFAYDQNAYTFPLSYYQWRLCTVYISLIYRECSTNKHEMIQNVYSLELPKYELFQNRADFQRKIRRVFYEWSHKVLGKRGERYTPATMEVGVSELQATEGINDKLYCFGSAIQRALFEHQSR
jgi:hypothetical protein